LRSAVAEVAHYRRIVIVGRDCPGLGVDDVRAALKALRRDELVLGPDGRGGCWLIGLQGERIDVLDGVRWCRGEDFAQLAGRSERVLVLGVKGDVDDAGDVARLRPTALPRPRDLRLPTRFAVASTLVRGPPVTA
ncbi:MAG: DUF2064 domain-containing protein, partial [Planctomycetota bacterium]